MPLMILPFRPGVVADDTASAAEGTWTDASGMRWHAGRPQTLGGYESITIDRVSGICRGMLGWSDNNGNPLLAIGTHTGLYAYGSGALYDITPSDLGAGLADGTGGAGFGTGAFSVGAYSQPSNVDYYPRTWTLSEWGQDLIACPRGASLYHWPAWQTGAPAVPITGAPAQAAGCFVTAERMVVAYGAHDGTAPDPKRVAWSDQEIFTDWTPTARNMAGDFRLMAGGRIVGHAISPAGPLLFTDQALYAMRFTGDPMSVYAFGEPLGTGCGLLAPLASASAAGRVFWLSNAGQFFMWSGGVPEPIPCPLLEALLANLSWVQADKIYAYVNAEFNEVVWAYPDLRDGNEISRTLTYNWVDGVWWCGQTTRTAWRDRAAGVLAHPAAVDAAGGLYWHERGASADGGVLSWSLTSAWLDGGDGETMVDLGRVQVDFRSVGQLGPALGLVEISIDYQYTHDDAGPVYTAGPYLLASGRKQDLRIKASHYRYRLSGFGAPASVRLGDLRQFIRGSGMTR
jgi:hypothetical protein